MKVLIYLNHPAHFHLFSNVMKNLKVRDHRLMILCKKKDVLEDLLINSRTEYRNVFDRERGNSKLAMIASVLRRGARMLPMIAKFGPDLMIGTAFELAHIGRILRIPFVSVNEDDAEVIPRWSTYSYPWATWILSPSSCNNGKWNGKTIRYQGYHELAYLHPNHFTPDRNRVRKYLDPDVPYVIIRFAKLTAHHDKGISGICNEIAVEIIKAIQPGLRVYITSERVLGEQLEDFRLCIDPLDIHHVLAFAAFYIGDSQTMAAEAGVLGTPFVRFNDFVGRIGYLNELENKYKLGYGIRTTEEPKLLETVTMLASKPELKQHYAQNRMRMLADKIDVAAMMTWFVEAYPESVRILRDDSTYQFRFRLHDSLLDPVN